MELTKQKEGWISDLEAETGQKVKSLDKLLGDEINWEQFWQTNISDVVLPQGKCRCRFVEISRRPKATTSDDMYHEGVGLIEKYPRVGEGDKYFYCSRCSQLWHEVEVSSGHYWAHHLYPVVN